MKRLKLPFLLILYALSRWPFLRFYPVFYDSFEYQKFAGEVTFNNFRQLLLSTHQPFHTFYLLIIAIAKLFPGVSPDQVLTYISFLSGAFILIIFYSLVSRINDDGHGFWASLFLLTFPYFFVITSNIFYEPVMLLFQIMTFYLLYTAIEKNNMFLIILSALSFSLSVSVFIGSLFLLPLIIYILMRQKSGNKQFTRSRLIYFFPSLIGFLILSDYLILGDFSTVFQKYLSHSADFTSLKGGLGVFLARSSKNIFVQSAANLSLSVSLIFYILLILTLKNEKKLRPFILSLLIPLFFLMQYWHAGLYGRLSVFIVFPAAYLFSAKYAPVRLKIVLLILTGLTAVSYALANLSPPPVYSYTRILSDRADKNSSFVISSDNNRFVYRENNWPLLSIGPEVPAESLLTGIIDTQQKAGRIVYIDSQAISYPYMQFDGNFYHTIPPSKFINKEMIKTIENYDFEIFRDGTKSGIFFVELKRKGSGQKFPQDLISVGEYISKSPFKSDPLFILPVKLFYAH